MMLLEVSARNWVCGEEISSLLSYVGSAIRSMGSKRFFGLLAEPRPRTGRGVFMPFYPAAGGAEAGAVGGAAAAGCAAFAPAAVLASRARWRVSLFSNLTLRFTLFNFLRSPFDATSSAFCFFTTRISYL